MSDKVQKIKEEIERRYNCEKCYPLDREANVAAAVLQELLLFIDSLPEEHNEDLEEASEEYAFTNWESDDYHEGAEEDIPFDPIGHTKKCFIAGAEWQKQQMMKDVMETTIVNDWQYGKDPDHAIIPAIHQRIGGFTVGDKVKIIILKTE